MSLLFDPRLFNFIMLGLSVAASVRWAWAGHWGDAAYWASAALITASVTWGKFH